MAEYVKNVAAGLPIYMYILLAFAGLMILISFFTPPMFVVEKSIISALSILLGFGWAYYVTVHLTDYAQAGAKIRAQRGDTVIEISGTKEEE